MLAILLVVQVSMSKRLHAFLDRQAQPDVWFQWASPRSSIAIGSAQEAAPTPREAHGDASSSVPAHRLCGWWRGEGKARPPQASQQLSAPVIQVPPHGSATMSHWFFSWSFIRALKSVRQPLDVRTSKARGHSASFGATRANTLVHRYQSQELPL
uniref:Secreted protein n=1 Tax=Timema monikensis TaxID=170555 RepID=A0A7R9E5B0_9NEOP|nr:unnamed protein product [Timema monikensis]